MFAAFSLQISLLLSGKGAKAGAAAAAQAPGLARVISCEGATAEYGVAENVVRIILGLHEKSSEWAPLTMICVCCPHVFAVCAR